MRKLLLVVAAIACIAADPLESLHGWELDARSLDIDTTQFVGDARRIDCEYGQHCYKNGPLFETLKDCGAAAFNLRHSQPIAREVGPLSLATVYYCTRELPTPKPKPTW